MLYCFRKFLLFIFALGLTTQVFAQSVIDDIDESPSIDTFTSELAEERIVKISPSKRVFLITNESNSFNKGDFISIIFEDKLVFRAISAKFSNGIAGVKVVKIYSLSLWNKMVPGLTIKILRGDDSYFLKDKNSDEDGDLTKIKDEDDLFNDTILDEDLSLNENNKRLIKTDNVVSLTYGTVGSIDQNGDTISYYILNGAWAYQLGDNVWGEIQYGQTIIRDFPDFKIDTTLTSFTVRLKYVVEAPFDSYIMPYAGYQSVIASSPGADTQEGLDLLEMGTRRLPVFGVTLLKRMVPAWFVRLDIGSDMVTAGMSLEF